MGRDEATMRAGAAKQGAAHGDNGETDGEEGGKLLSSVVSLSNAVVLDCCWDDDTLMVATGTAMIACVCGVQGRGGCRRLG